VSDYTRTILVNLQELVPARDQLPLCHAWKQNLKRCPNKAKYELNGRPVCGQHITPNTIFVPEKWVAEA
jgi:hypothetical protein